MLARTETPLKRILEDEGRTQAWLARRLGVKPQQVGIWVHGIYRPLPETQEAIAAALGRTVEELWPHHTASHQTPDQSIPSTEIAA